MLSAELAKATAWSTENDAADRERVAAELEATREECKQRVRRLEETLASAQADFKSTVEQLSTGRDEAVAAEREAGRARAEAAAAAAVQAAEAAEGRLAD